MAERREGAERNAKMAAKVQNGNIPFFFFLARAKQPKYSQVNIPSF